MAIKKYKPTSPGRRGMTVADFSEITKKEPEQSLVEPLTKPAGATRKAASRPGSGAAATSGCTGIIDFKRDKDGVPATVAAIEYDPNRSARIALLHYADGEKRYILAPLGLKVGDKVESGPNADIRPGNALPLSHIPVGTLVHAIELKPGKGAQLVRGGRHGGPAHGP